MGYISMKMISTLFQEERDHKKEDTIFNEIGLSSWMDYGNTFFIAKSTSNHQFSWRFATSCVDHFGYSKSYLEDPRNAMFTKGMLSHVFNDTAYDNYFFNLINFQAKNSMLKFSKVLTIKFKEFSRKVLVEITPIYKNKAEVAWMTFIKDLTNLNISKFILNDSLSKVGTTFYKTENLEGEVKYIADEYVREMFDMPESISNPIKYLNGFLKNNHPEIYQKQEQDYQKLVNSEIDSMEIEFYWRGNLGFKVFNITTFVVDIPHYDEIEEVLIDQVDTVSIIRDITDYRNEINIIKRRNNQLENVLEMKDMHLEFVEAQNDKLTYVEERTLKMYGLEEGEYVKVPSGKYQINWRYLFEKYFVFDDATYQNFLLMNAKVVNSDLKGFEIILVRKDTDNKKCIKRLIKRLDNNEVVVVTEETDNHYNIETSLILE